MDAGKVRDTGQVGGGGGGYVDNADRTIGKGRFFVSGEGVEGGREASG